MVFLRLINPTKLLFSIACRYLNRIDTGERLFLFHFGKGKMLMETDTHAWTIIW